MVAELMRMTTRRTSDTGDGFLARQIGDVDKGVVERGIDVGNTENEFSLSDLRTERDSGFFLGDLLLGSLHIHRSASSSIIHCSPDRRDTRTVTRPRVSRIYGVEHVPF